MAVLSDKGLTCSNSLCRQRDFLPFTCNKCGNVFCLEHYVPDAHSCPKKNAGDRRVYVCPDCLEVVTLKDLETEDEVKGRHRPQCRPELRAQREQMRKGRHCPVKGCKERLTPISSIKCPHCQMDVCIKHRLKEDHNCEVLLRNKNERKRNSLLKQLSSSASKGLKMKWHSDSTSSSDPTRCIDEQPSNNPSRYAQPPCTAAAAAVHPPSVGSPPVEGCECDVYACWRPAGVQKDRKEKKGGICTIM